MQYSQLPWNIQYFPPEAFCWEVFLYLGDICILDPSECVHMFSCWKLAHNLLWWTNYIKKLHQSFSSFILFFICITYNFQINILPLFSFLYFFLILFPSRLSFLMSFLSSTTVPLFLPFVSSLFSFSVVPLSFPYWYYLPSWICFALSPIFVSLDQCLFFCLQSFYLPSLKQVTKPRERLGDGLRGEWRGQEHPFTQQHMHVCVCVCVLSKPLQCSCQGCSLQTSLIHLIQRQTYTGLLFPHLDCTHQFCLHGFADSRKPFWFLEMSLTACIWHHKWGTCYNITVLNAW